MGWAMNSLAKYEAACRAVAEARTVDEVKDFRDRAVAMAAYARQAKNRDLEADAVEIRMRATRRLHDLMEAQREMVGLADGGTAMRARVTGQPEVPTLASQGIDKNLAHQARTLGKLSDENFEEAVTDAREAVTSTKDPTPKPAEPSASILEKARESYAALVAELPICEHGAEMKRLGAAINQAIERAG
jgi:hypothetical protein